MAMLQVCGVSRKIERATYEAVPFRFIAGNLHPDHDTLAAFRRTFLPELKELFVQVLLLAKAGGRAEVGHDEPGWDQGACRGPPLAKR
jgi:transposase